MADDAEKDWLARHARVQEKPFHSETALIGPLIARFRTLWNNVATRWYVRPLLQQQNKFNRLLVERLHDHEQRLLAQDREQSALAHDLAELEAQLVQTNRLLASIDERLARLESDKRPQES